jgi:guanylate kinase
MSSKTQRAQVLGNLDRGMAFVLSAPAGTGKTTLVKMLAQEFDRVKESVSCTTREPRVGEVPGEHYHFLTEEEFLCREAANDFLESVELFGYRYGTSKLLLENLLQEGNHVILTIDTQGALKLKDSLLAKYIFLSPPSLEELRQRLINRKTETLASINRRVSWAETELALREHYDYHIVNEDLDVAYDVLRSIIIAEEHKVLSSTKNKEKI